MKGDLEQARNISATSVIGQRISLRKSGAGHVGCCPFHEDKTPSLYVYNDTGRYWCFGCGAGGDAIDFVMRFEGCSFPEAVDRIATGSCSFGQRPWVSKVSKGRSENADFARNLWDGAGPVCGTIGESYLRNRGISIGGFRHPPPVRFDFLTHSSTRQRHPTLISKLEDQDGNCTSIQRTYLTDDGWKLPKVANKMTLGPLTGNATKLAPANDEIVLCEGLEDGLSIQQSMPDISVWVTAGTSNLATITLPPQCKRVTIAADNDEAGSLAAHKACEAYLRQGFDARIIHPDHQFKDFNEQLQKGQSL